MTIETIRSDALVLAIDPGATVGWTLGRGVICESSNETDSQLFLDLMLGMHEAHGLTRVVLERFDLRQYSNDAVDTVELIGAIKFICRIRSWPWVEISASDKRKFIEYSQTYLKGHAADAEAIRLYDLEYGKW